MIVLSTLIQLAFAGALDGAVGLALASLPEAVVLEEPLRCFVLKYLKNKVAKGIDLDNI